MRGLALIVAFVACCVTLAGPFVPAPPDTEGMEPAVAAALAAAHEAVVRDLDDAQAWARFAATCHAHGLYPTATLAYQNALVREPRRFEWRYLLAVASDLAGSSLDTVEGGFADAVEVRADYAPLYLRRGRALTRHGELERAREVLQTAVALAPRSAFAHRALGQVYLSLGELPAALAELQAAAEARPDDGAAWAGLARAYVLLGDEERAEAASKRARRLRPIDSFPDPVLEREVDALGVSARHLYARAQKRLDAGDLEGAAATLERLRSMRPDDGDAWYLTALLEMRRSNAAPAMRHLQRAVELDERHVRAHVQLARFHAALGRPDEALSHYRRALRTTPGDPALLAATGHLLASRGEMAEALEIYRRLLAISPGEPAIHFNIGTCHAQLDQLPQALEQFRETVRLDPSYADAHHRLGLVLERMGRPDEARVHFERARRLGPTPTSPVEPQSVAEEFADISRALYEGSNRYLGGRRLLDAQRRLAAAADATDRLRARLALVRALLEAGEVERAVVEIERAADEADESLADPLLYELQRTRGLTYMRQSEVQNCVLRHNRDCCIFPLEGGGEHAEKEPARNARQSFEAILKRRPDDLAVRWLLNVMGMALGDWPRGIPQNLRLPPKSFESDHDVGRFPDIATDLGVDKFDLCGGAVADDFDGDGRLDVVTSTYDPRGALTYYRNDGNGFEDRSAASGLDEQLGGLNTIGADYDGDGDPDLLVLRGAWLFDDGRIRNSLLRNDGERGFVDVTREAGMHRPAYPTQTAAWGDFDNDGDLDLYVCNESRKFDPVDPADFPSQLFVNDGKGKFTDVAARAGVTNDRYCKGVAAGDYDDDGDLDLYVSNVSDNRLYRNDGDGTFSDVAREAGVIEPRGRSFATWFFDYDNDGRLDLFVAGFDTDIADLAAESLGREHDAQSPRLYRNAGDGKFHDVTRAMGLARPFLPMGANFGDLDNDGWLDIYLATGDPDFESLMPNVMLRNDRGRRFQDVTRSGGFGHLQKGHGVAFADLDNDGDQDIYHQLGGFFPGDRFHNALFANPGNANRSSWIELTGKRSNRAGFGARIRLVVREGGRTREIHRAVGSVSSFGGSPRRQEIGLGRASSIELLEIFWPASGTRQVFRDVPASRLVRIVENSDEIVLADPPQVRLPHPGD
ncbi:MAG: tetratricopeptide repeat protein [bacterium]|nr:tetratricopeptide repeat protein [bacterium]